MAILQTENLKKYYGSGDTQVRALDGVDLAVENGEFVAIVGTSGSGKSTLLHMLGGLDRPTSGRVTVDGKDIFSLKDEALTIFRRRKIGFVFQSYNLVRCSAFMKILFCPWSWTDGGRIRTTCRRSSLSWGLRKNGTAGQISCQEASSSAWRSRGRWRQSPPSFWRTSPPEIWTPEPVRMCWD